MHHHSIWPVRWWIWEECKNHSRPDALMFDIPLVRGTQTTGNQHYAAQFVSKGLGRPIFTALVRPLQASTLAGTARSASRCRFLIWPWCASWWRTTTTEPKTTLWASSLCPSQACGQVLVHAHTNTHTGINSRAALPTVACCILMITTFLFRLSTRSLIEGRWLQSVPRNAFHPCQSDPQRSSHQERVGAPCNSQRQEGLTRIRK